ncbi:hypothetical protein Hypma_015383 [Hypsizygus marmoreus]|uniref:Uncharacterized protein n=1 Tax=Hypsizygus marmoreus TaxID=39966 RepID=A0A369KAU5_HYPMA|nr:hypothetical protein Hypma_015383 [Hypsizygus marmoreus]
MTANPDFDFKSLLLASCAAEVNEELDLFSPSPLSSATSSPLTSVPTSCASSPVPPSTANTNHAAAFHSLPSKPPPTPPPFPATSSSKATNTRNKNKRNKARGHANRKRKCEQEQEGTYGIHATRPSVRKKFVIPSQPLKTNLETDGIPIASTGFIGRRDKKTKRLHTLEDLTGPNSPYGFRLVSWSGSGPAVSIVDGEGRVIAVLAGRPEDESWDDSQREAAVLLQRGSRRCYISKAARKKARRGRFSALATGVSYGGGQRMPMNLVNSTKNTKIVNELMGHRSFQRFAGFASSTFSTWAPKLYAHYSDRMGSLFAHDPRLRRNFRSSVFTAATFNLGPRTVCFKHTDFANLPFGWCAITALGDFDPKHGGHLILWECHLVIEFPPGSTVLIPSAVVAHFNTPVRKNETRYSFTQYTSGGLFRWVEHRMQKEEHFYVGKSMEEILELDRENAKRWEFGLSLFSTLDELKSIPNTNNASRL